MKSLIFSIALIASVSVGDAPDLTGITKALQAGDVKTLSSFFDDNVELAVIDDEDIYAKAEASKVLSTFFTSNKAKSFAQVHKGTSRGADSHYIIGDLVAGGKTFRTYIYMKEVAGSYKIQELRIEE